MLKRNPKISFGNFYVFPGGMIEKQDHVETWKNCMSSYYSQVGSRYMDFAKRICALRELFEETNLLFARRGEMKTNETPSLDNYNMKYKQDFV
jgi:8-oxo-dGTP pyrophosphatase MutT (NUDIX family)